MMSIQRTRILCLVGLLSAACAIGCSSDPEPPPASTDAGPTADGGKSDAGDQKDGATTNPEAGPVASAKVGNVTIAQTKTAAIYSTTAFAGFYNAAAVAAVPGCTTTTFGACSVDECTPPAASDAGTPASDAGTPAQPAAGDITISGGAIAAPGIVLSAKADGTYDPKTLASQAFEGGASLSIKGGSASSVVPAFDGKVVAPTDIVMTPELSLVTPTTVDRAAAYDVKWTSGGAGDVTVALRTVDSGTFKSVTITCKAAASAGTVTVPKEAAAKLQSTSATVSGTIMATPSNKTQVTAGDFKIDLNASGTKLQGTLATK